MAITCATAKMMIDLVDELKLGGNALNLGVQKLLFYPEELSTDYAKSLGDKKNDSQALYRYLGFKNLDSLDASEFEGAEIIEDLNCVFESRPNYDLVFDNGTMEHVFHVPNLLKNMHNMLKVGGRAMHFVPCSNALDHGFYMLSPTLFIDYYRSNNYEIEKSFLCRYSIVGDQQAWELFNYYSTFLHRFSIGALDNSFYGYFIVAKKTQKSSADIVPQQSLYADSSWLKKELNKTVEPVLSNIDALPKSIYIFGFNNYSLTLAERLHQASIKILGIFDTFKYGFSSPYGVVIDPRRLARDKFQQDLHVLFCAKSASGEDRNDVVLNSFAAQIATKNINTAFLDKDTQLNDHPRLNHSYNSFKSDAETFKPPIIDRCLRMELARTYFGAHHPYEAFS